LPLGDERESEQSSGERRSFEAVIASGDDPAEQQKRERGNLPQHLPPGRDPVESGQRQEETKCDEGGSSPEEIACAEVNQTGRDKKEGDRHKPRGCQRVVR
jgi:hypothetical protein